MRLGASGFLLKDTPPRELIDAVRKVAAGDTIALGHSNAQISAELFISVTTVKSHVGRILDKLAVTNRVQIAVCVHNASD